MTEREERMKRAVCVLCGCVWVRFRAGVPVESIYRGRCVNGDSTPAMCSAERRARKKDEDDKNNMEKKNTNKSRTAPRSLVALRILARKRLTAELITRPGSPLTWHAKRPTATSANTTAAAAASVHSITRRKRDSSKMNELIT